MADRDFYQANIDGKISSIYLNLDAYTEVNASEYSRLCWLFIRLKVEREDGLSHDDEYSELTDYEDNLIEHLSGDSIQFAGRITTNGIRQFYFYAVDSFDYELAIEVFPGKESSYQYRFGSKRNPGWSQYKNVLYPGKYGTDRVMPGWNEGVIGMKPGGKRLVKVPAALGYGARGVQDVVPPNARLIFVIDLLELDKH